MAKKKYACQAHYINFGIASKKQKYWIIFPKQAFSLYLKKEAVGAVLRQILISDRFAKKVSFISIFSFYTFKVNSFMKASFCKHGQMIWK